VVKCPLLMPVRPCDAVCADAARSVAWRAGGPDHGHAVTKRDRGASPRRPSISAPEGGDDLVRSGILINGTVMPRLAS